MPPHVLVNSALGDVHQSGGQVKVLRKTYRIERERERDEFTAYACARARGLLLFRTCASRAATCTRVRRTLRSLELARSACEKKKQAAALFFPPSTISAGSYFAVRSDNKMLNY